MFNVFDLFIWLKINLNYDLINCIISLKVGVYRCYVVILIDNSWEKKWRSYLSNEWFIMKYECYMYDLIVF